MKKLNSVERLILSCANHAGEQNLRQGTKPASRPQGSSLLANAIRPLPFWVPFSFSPSPSFLLFSGIKMVPKNKN